LARRYSQRASAAILLLTGLGTNLAHYAIYDACMSHIYSFALLTLYLDQVDLFAIHPRPTRALLLGFLIGFGFMVRNYSVLFSLFYGAPLLQRRIPFRIWIKGALIAMAAALVTLTPQLALWKYSTGSWFTYSYGQEGFTHLRDPFFAKVFWGWEKGLFLYFPILLVFLLGLVTALSDPTRRAEAGIALFCFALLSCLVAAWSSWAYGSSFGHRAFIDIYPFLALGGGWLAQKLLDRGGRRALVVLVGIGIFYGMTMTGLYWFHGMRQSGMTRQDVLELPYHAVRLPFKIFRICCQTFGFG
jgi:hypothetical protein